MKKTWLMLSMVATQFVCATNSLADRSAEYGFEPVTCASPYSSFNHASGLAKLEIYNDCGYPLDFSEAWITFSSATPIHQP